jgi:hypothetical protein
MKNVKFEPWIGDHYQQAPLGKRILILGESHYDWDSDNPINDKPDTTSIVIQKQLDGDYTKAFWTHIAKAFLNHNPTLDEKREFWHSVAFYNYVQSSAGFGARVTPSSDQWTSSEPAFFEILEALQPQLMVVLGYRLWERLPNANCEAGQKIPGAEHVNTCRYVYQTGNCLAISLKHPSSGFNGMTWHAPISNAIKIA